MQLTLLLFFCGAVVSSFMVDTVFQLSQRRVQGDG